MPKRQDIETILVIGSGPIVIGQACEFDYSGTQACKALREEGYRVVLVNSNPATIMTDPDTADRTYVEPMTVESLTQIIEAESLRAAGEAVDVTHINLNDQTVEGLAHQTRPIFSVQYHPEASPGPHDASFFFGRVRELVERHRSGERVTGAQIASDSSACG